ncbi:MAG: DUF2617 family protein [Planctomycetes bacterium]|nr:DUF2617 family protein [Planctomycetota bacterium]
MDASERQLGVADLRLSLYLRTLHPEFFSIRARRQFSHATFTFEVWLLDVGHVVAFTDSGEAITEVIVPRDVELPRRGLARTLDLVGEHEHRLEARGPIIYHMAYQVDAQDAGTYLREAEELLASARQGHLFNEASPEVARRPFSYAVPEPKGRGLLVHTWHGFPAESTILRTQTLIERVET